VTKVNITTLEAAKCLSFLESAAAPIVAAELAKKLRLSGSHETQRRHVRAIIKYLRDNGSQIVATLQGGYFLTEDPVLWRDYLEGRQIDAKRILGETHKRKKMLTDSQGQGVLFENRICFGVASMGTG
jgi:biotin operon repressor